MSQILWQHLATCMKFMNRTPRYIESTRNLVNYIFLTNAKLLPTLLTDTAHNSSVQHCSQFFSPTLLTIPCALADYKTNEFKWWMIHVELLESIACWFLLTRIKVMPRKQNSCNESWQMMKSHRTTKKFQMKSEN